jgi:hypothetical protein
MHNEAAVPDSGSEQRRHPRVNIFREIACQSNGVGCRSEVADLSVGGMFIDLHRPPFTPGTALMVRFQLQEADPPLLVSAVVNYVQDGIGMGIRFVELAEADQERIAAFVDEAKRRKGPAPPLRKSARVWVQVPVRLRALGNGAGPGHDEAARIVTLSKHGACLESSQTVEIGAKVLIGTPRGRVFKGNVVWVGSAASRSESQVGIQCRGLAQDLGFQFP